MSSSIIGWNDVIKKEVRGSNGEDLLQTSSYVTALSFPSLFHFYAYSYLTWHQHNTFLFLA
jgi:hypothetical protein